MFKGDYPLTEAAAQAKADWIPDTERLISCWVKAMPFLMITPHPVEFVQQGEDILMRFEEDDAERLVHMNSNDLSSQNGSSLLGYSQGFWQGNTLLVETTNIDSEAFDDQGTPVSKDIRLVERFTLSEDEQRLDYRISIFDSETFAQPFDLTSYWVWRPEREVQEWDCVDS
jgi:hypothetical protein